MKLRARNFEVAVEVARAQLDAGRVALEREEVPAGLGELEAEQGRDAVAGAGEEVDIAGAGDVAQGDGAGLLHGLLGLGDEVLAEPQGHGEFAAGCGLERLELEPIVFGAHRGRGQRERECEDPA